MIITGALVPIVAFELNIFIAAVLVDDDIRVNLGEVVSHLFYFFIGEIIVGKGDGAEIPRMGQEPAVIVLVGYYSSKQKPLLSCRLPQLFIGEKGWVYPSSRHFIPLKKVSLEPASAGPIFPPASRALP